jgi:hypothetical protein
MEVLCLVMSVGGYVDIMCGGMDKLKVHGYKVGCAVCGNKILKLV